MTNCRPYSYCVEQVGSNWAYLSWFGFGRPWKLKIFANFSPNARGSFVFINIFFLYCPIVNLARWSRLAYLQIKCCKKRRLRCIVCRKLTSKVWLDGKFCTFLPLFPFLGFRFVSSQTLKNQIINYSSRPTKFGIKCLCVGCTGQA